MARACACPRCGCIATGKPDPGIEAIIFANVRTPAERLGDLRAQVAANRRAEARLQALAGKYGADVLLGIMSEVQDYSETMMRAALRLLPDGEASFEDIFDGDGVIAAGETEDATFTVRLCVRKSGDSISVDFTGSDPAVAGPMNAPLTVTASGVFCALKMIVDPKSLIPPNSGCWRPVSVTAPEGCVVNARLPAPVVYANHEMSHRIADMVMAAMFQITPRDGHGGLAGDLGGGDLRRHRLSQRRAVCQLRVGQGRVRRAAGQGRHQRRGQHHQQHDEHADRNPGDEFPVTCRGIRPDPRQWRRRHLARRTGRAPGLARVGAGRSRRGLLRADGNTAVWAGWWTGRRGGEADLAPAGWQRAEVDEQGWVYRAGWSAGGGRGAGVWGVWVAERKGSRAVGGGSVGWVCDDGGGEDYGLEQT